MVVRRWLLVGVALITVGACSEPKAGDYEQEVELFTPTLPDGRTLECILIHAGVGQSSRLGVDCKWPTANEWFQEFQYDDSDRTKDWFPE